MEITLKEEQIKTMLEEIIFNLFQERKDIFREIIEDVIEDIGLTRAIEEGRKNDFVSQDEIIEVIDNEIGI